LSEFLKRTFTGAGIVIFILGGFWLHPVTFFLVGLILLAGMQYEYYQMIRNTGVAPQFLPGIYTGIIAYTVSTMVAAGMARPEWFFILAPVFFFIVVTEIYRKKDNPFNSLAHTFFAVIYAAVPLSLFPFAAYGHSGLNALLGSGNMSFSPGIVIGFFLLIWSNDTGAYLTGVSIGKHKLMPAISPKKTWEGFFGGFLLAAIVAFFLADFLGVVDRLHWIIISIIVSVAGTYGDLAESMLKRSTGVKDSGNIMPGHGGFLDRFDSTIMAFPLVYLFITLFG
jgi:phosphatidate cytidylyltransferase